ncbi:MAG: HEAT repeat domain-containing protein, partial [Planctomycetaceae bacterium]
MDSESKAIRLPIPGVGKLLFAAMLVGLGWLIWSTDVETPTNPRAQKREKLWSPDSNSIERIQAVEEWAAQGEFAIPELLRALDSPHDTVRATGVLALSRIGPLAKGCIPQVIDLLDDREETVRSNAVHALIQIGRDSPEAVPGLIERLNDPAGSVRLAAEDGLFMIGKSAIPALCEYVRTPEAAGRKHGLSVLLRIRSEHALTTSVAHLALQDARIEVRIQALKILYILNSFTIDEMVDCLANENDELMLLALRSMAKRGDDAVGAVPAILRVARQHLEAKGASDREIVLTCVNTLIAIGPAANEAIPFLHTLIKDPDPRCRAAAVSALSIIAADAANGELIVETLMHDRSPEVVIEAAFRVGQYYPEKIPAILPDLKRRLKTQKAAQVMHVASAVIGFGPAAGELTAELGQCLDNPMLPRNLVIHALGRIGPQARSEIPRLLDLLEDENLQAALFEALGEIRPQGAEIDRILPVMIEAIDMQDENLRFRGRGPGMPMWDVENHVHKKITAYQAMGKMLKGRDDVLTLLLESVAEPESTVRWSVLWALTESMNRQPEVLEQLVNATTDNSLSVQVTA